MLMYKTARLANWLKVRPSTLWNLPYLLNDLGIEEVEHNDHLLDFDFAVLEFWDFLENMREQQRKVSVPSSMRLKDNQTWGRKWTDEEILEKYAQSRQRYGPVSDAITEDELWDVMEDWDTSIEAEAE